MKLHRTLFTAWVFAAGVALHAQNAHNMVVQTNKLGAEIQPTMYGLFFEDINYGADGGLYAELVKNRSFEFPQRFMGWNVFGNVTLMDDGPFERNPHYVRLGNSGHREKHTGIENEGFFGIGVKEGAEYRFSVWARGENQKLRIELIKNDTMEERQAFESKELTVNSKDWKQYEVILKSPRTEPKAHLRIFLESAGTVDLICEVVNKCLELCDDRSLDYKPILLTGEGISHIRGVREHLAARLNRVVEIVSPNLPYYNKAARSSLLSLLNMALDSKRKNNFFYKFFNL